MVTFNAGDKVQLQSGGVPMTVEKLDGGYCHCLWFDVKTGELCERRFPTAVLKPCPETVYGSNQDVVSS